MRPPPRLPRRWARRPPQSRGALDLPRPPTTAFFSVAPKVAALGLLIRVVTGPLEGFAVEVHQVIWVLAAASMIIGGYAALSQSNIKRLLKAGVAVPGCRLVEEQGVGGK